MKRILGFIGLVFLWAGVTLAQSSDFKAKWEKLAAHPDKVFKVTARPGEEIPEATLNISFGPGSLLSVSRGRVEKPKPILEEMDIVAVINRNLREVKFCYCQALKKDPEFEGDAIVGIKILNSGKISSVEIEPHEIAEHHFGKCLAPRIARWRFPTFTGQKEEGIVLRSIGYEFPLSFRRAQ